MDSNLRIAGLPALVLAFLSTAAPAQTAAPEPALSASAPALGTIKVTASADASAEGLSKPYAGGQVARGGRAGILGTEDMMDSPFSITSYTQEFIKDQQAASVGDVLLNDPTVRVARGFGNYQQLYMVRGFPVYSDDMSYNGLYGLLPRQYLATEYLERVEVLRGASAFINGAAPGGSGIGGAVNVVPKRAPNYPLSEITFGVEGGSQAFVQADLARRFGPDQSTGIRLNLARHDGETSVSGEHRHLDVIGVGLDWHSRNLRLSADIGYQDHRVQGGQPSVTFGPGIPIGPVPSTDRSIAPSWTYSNERDTFGTLRAEYDVLPNVTVWAAGGGRSGKEANIFANPTVTNADGTSTAARADNAREDTVWTGEAGVRGKFATGSIGHTVVASAAAYDLKSKNAYHWYQAFPGNIYAPADVLPPTVDSFVGGVLGSPLVTARTKTSSVAIADTLSMFGDRVLFTLGARHQKIETDSYNYDTGALGSSYSASRVTPVAGLVFKATPRVSVYATYIEGLVAGDTAPSLSGTTPVANAGQVMKPYQSKQIELGAKLDLGRAGGTVSVFETRKPTYGVNTATALFEEVSHQRNRGLELSVFGEPVRGLRVLGGITFLNTDADGKDAIGAPRTQANLGMEWDVPGVRGLALNGRVIHTASQYADAGNTQEVPAWTRLDVGARYLLDLGAQQWTIRARIDNLTDRRYWASAGGYPGSGYLTIGAPRTFQVSASVNF